MLKDARSSGVASAWCGVPGDTETIARESRGVYEKHRQFNFSALLGISVWYAGAGLQGIPQQAFAQAVGCVEFGTVEDACYICRSRLLRCLQPKLLRRGVNCETSPGPYARCALSSCGLQRRESISREYKSVSRLVRRVGSARALLPRGEPSDAVSVVDAVHLLRLRLLRRVRRDVGSSL